MIVVANLWQLSRDGGKFDQKNKTKILHANAKISKDYVDEINASSIDSGRFYEVDEEKTKEFHDAKNPVKTETKKIEK